MATEEKAGSIPAPAGCPHLDGFDPLDGEQVTNPWPLLKKARAEVPVFYMPAYDQWCVTRHEDVSEVYRDLETFSNQGAHEMRVPIPDALKDELPPGYRFPFAGQVNTIDPPEHTRVRKLMLQIAFAPRRVNEKEGEIVELCDELIDGFIADGSADLNRQYCGVLPVTVISRMLGVPAEESASFGTWAEDFFQLANSVELPEEEAIERWRRLYEFHQWTTKFLAERREHPQDDLTTDLLEATTDDGSPSLSDAEMLSNILGIVAAGGDTTAITLTHMLYLLLSDRKRWDEVEADRSLVPNVFEETLRLMGPVRGLWRTVMKDTELGGVKIPKGAHLYIHLGSAGRDESVFSEPEEFDIHRANANKHLEFGIWGRFCIGAPLARIEGRVALERIQDRLPNLRLADENVKIDYIPNMMMPLPRSLRVEWDT